MVENGRSVYVLLESGQCNELTRELSCSNCEGRRSAEFQMDCGMYELGL